MRNWFVHIAIIFVLCCQCTTKQTHEAVLADFELLGPDSVMAGQKFMIRLMGKEKLSNSPVNKLRAIIPRAFPSTLTTSSISWRLYILQEPALIWRLNA